MMLNEPSWPNSKRASTDQSGSRRRPRSSVGKALIALGGGESAENPVAPAWGQSFRGRRSPGGAVEQGTREAACEPGGGSFRAQSRSRSSTSSLSNMPHHPGLANWDLFSRARSAAAGRRDEAPASCGDPALMALHVNGHSNRGGDGASIPLEALAEAPETSSFEEGRGRAGAPLPSVTSEDPSDWADESSSGSGIRNPRVLIAEDDDLCRRVLTMSLKIASVRRAAGRSVVSSFTGQRIESCPHI